jgi:DtxR family Mn-dependent transcriptional regulator
MDDSPQLHLSRSAEDYLKAVYSLTEREESASTSALAESLDVQPASVTGMVKRLAESGYLEHARYRGVRLTEAGSREALRIIRRHRILETYLHIHLGYSWEDVHQEAERLEHAASDALIDRMATILEHPSHDPHGAPIPTSSGEIEISALVTLNEVEPGVAVEIRSVQDEEPDRLRYLETLGLVPGVRIVVQERAPFDGPTTISIGNRETAEIIGSDLADGIFVAPAQGL